MKTAAETTALSRYRWFGRILETEIPLATRLPRGTGPADAKLALAGAPYVENGRTIFRSFDAGRAAGTHRLVVYDLGEKHRLQFTGIATFDVAPKRIDCHLAGGTLVEAENLFLGLVSAFWLERSHASCLHAAAVAAAIGGIGFLGFNRAGKSSLAASFLRAEFPLLTDDVLALEFDERGCVKAQPSFPQIRLWPASAEQLVEDAGELLPTHPNLEKKRVSVGGGGLGAFHDQPTTLSALLLPERGGSEIAISLLPPREATIELVRHSFLSALGDAAFGVGRRFERFVAIAERVPVFRLTYPDGLEHLPRVREAILKRLSAL